MSNYEPLAGVKVLDLGILIPAALVSGKLAALGADVVKVELPPNGDRIRKIPPFASDGRSPQHMGLNWGKRSIALNALVDEDRETLIDLIRASDVIVENQLSGFWKGIGVDFEALRAERPELIVCSITGFGQTGPWAGLPAHGLNVDALADGINLIWEDGRPHRGPAFTSWGNELGALSAVAGTCAALASVRAGGEGAWIDISCWDALVETHRTEIAMSHRTGEPFSYKDTPRQALYTTYLSSDEVPVLIGALEYKFWQRFCDGIDRPDLLGHHGGGELEYGDDDAGLEAQLEAVFAEADADTWAARFRDWDVPGGPVLDVPAIMASDHFAARQISAGDENEWPEVATSIRWHHTGTRAGLGLTPPPELDDHGDEIRRQWLG